MVKRSAILCAGAAFAGVLTACGGGGTDGAPAPEPQQPSGVTIDAPKDAMAKDRCGLLPADAAAGLGLAAQGEEQSDPLDPEAPSPCVWNSADGKNRLSLTPLEGRSIQAYYDNKAKYADYQELSIAGHPAARANQGDPKQDGTCDIFLATKNDQILSAQAHVMDTNQDACGIAQKALEAAVPTLPAAQ
ncbi:DUF3558 family protein [Saccharopolyspora sp. TS4A08]|uniref:DUF3558 family protein n=1 Tax=Saccharopolyspora ipomoeae TaxID=3042027 RepID=A0ABT6PK62_9PSEU|nr:DUF3558 family protein [Saccharopolyspora sp. TS4A08]MDI2028390.1 DUF3558 family protein [Saccharopolyspora sp. TS4A08]